MKGNRTALHVGLAVLAVFTVGGFGDLRPWMYSLATVACAGVVAGAQGTPWLAAPWLVHVGRLSYAWYLWHGVTMRADLPVWLTVPASLLLAQLSWLWVDRKAQTHRVSAPRRSVFPVKQEA